MKVNLKVVIECIEFENENLNHFYNKNTGIIIYKESSEDWERELIEYLYDLENNPQDYIKLPKTDEINELNMMIDFCNSFSDFSIHDIINKNINDIKKIIEMKKIIQVKNLLSEWYDYREQSEKQIAIDWCNHNNIEYILE